MRVTLINPAVHQSRQSKRSRDQLPDAFAYGHNNRILEDNRILERE
jgi:hypothetical protein